jgi:hypothetical protein
MNKIIKYYIKGLYVLYKHENINFKLTFDNCVIKNKTKDYCLQYTPFNTIFNPNKLNYFAINKEVIKKIKIISKEWNLIKNYKIFLKQYIKL